MLGGGVAGLTIAWELVRRGRDVVVLRSDLPAASPMAAGMLAPGPEVALNQGLARLAVESLRYYPSFLDALAADTDLPTGFVRSGVLRVAFSDAEAETLREGTGSYEAAGMPSHWLRPPDIAREAPGLNRQGLAGGLLSYDEAQVQPAWLLAALEDAIARRGGRIGAGMVGLEPSDGGVEVRLATGGTVAADQVVVAMGSWSGTLPGLDYPVRPVKGQLLVFPAGTPGPAPMIFTGHDYLLTKADGTVVAGGTMEEAGYSLEPDAHAEQLRASMTRAWPALADVPAETRVGLRPAAPDGLPVVGALDGTPRVYMFSGHFRNGFLLSPLSARLAATEMMGEGRSELFRTMRPGRLRSRAVAGGS